MRPLVILGTSFGLTLALFAACKLDLDESLIEGGDASLGGTGGADGGGSGGTGGTGTGATGGTGGAQGDGGPCDGDTQCKSDAACIEGRCAGGQCLYELCPTTQACQASSCDTTSSTCTAPTSYGFKAATIELDSDIGCSGAAPRCVAGFGDLVFVVTSDGALNAWRTSNPATPQKLTVDAPTFPIARMIASEDTLLLMSAVSAGTLQLAWIKAPSDPKATSLSVSSAGVNLSGNVSATYPAGAGSFLLVYNDSTSFYPAALVTPPVPNQSTVTQYPSTGLAPGATIVAGSASRLLSYRVDSSASPVVAKMAIVTGAGTANAQTGTEKPLGVEAPSSLGAHYFWTGYEGSVLWSTNKVVQDDAGTPKTSAVVLRWPITAGADTIDESLEVELAAYTVDDWNVVRRGPVALVDPSTVLATTAAPVDPTAQTLVRSVTRSGTTLSVGTATSTLPFAVNSIGIAANRKAGFILTPSNTTPALKTTLHVFAPGCG